MTDVLTVQFFKELQNSFISLSDLSVMGNLHLNIVIDEGMWVSHDFIDLPCLNLVHYR